jgi:hypothetical protein
MGTREEQPAFVPPMPLTSGRVPDVAAWTLELKWDGCRAQLRYDRRTVSLCTRSGRDCSEEFPELTAIAETLGKRRVTLDGELVCLRDDGRPDFARLRSRLAGTARNPRPAMLQVFDILHLDGHSTRELPYRERRAMLDGLGLDGFRMANAREHRRRKARGFRHAHCPARPGGRRRQAPRLDLPPRATHPLLDQAQASAGRAASGHRDSALPPEGRVEAVFVARRLPDGSTRGAGSIELGLRAEVVVDLEQRLAGLPVRRRGAVAWYPAEVSVIASGHGLPDGPVRDAILLRSVDG